MILKKNMSPPARKEKDVISQESVRFKEFSISCSFLALVRRSSFVHFAPSWFYDSAVSWGMQPATGVSRGEQSWWDLSQFLCWLHNFQREIKHYLEPCWFHMAIQRGTEFLAFLHSLKKMFVHKNIIALVLLESYSLIPVCLGMATIYVVLQYGLCLNIKCDCIIYPLYYSMVKYPIEKLCHFYLMYTDVKCMHILNVPLKINILLVIVSM